MPSLRVALRRVSLLNVVNVRELVPGGLEQVVPEEETPERCLHPSTHLHQVLQDVLAGCLLGLHVNCSHSYKQVSGVGQGGGGGREAVRSCRITQSTRMLV